MVRQFFSSQESDNLAFNEEVSVVMITLRENLGGAGRHMGGLTAQTPYVAFSDDDSWWAPGALQRAVELFNSNPTLGLIAAQILVGPDAEEEAEFLEITYAPGVMSGANMSHHEGREFGLILEGELVIELGFESSVLEAVDSIIPDSLTPHRLINKGSQPMRAVWVVLSRR